MKRALKAPFIFNETALTVMFIFFTILPMLYGLQLVAALTLSYSRFHEFN